MKLTMVSLLVASSSMLLFASSTVRFGPGTYTPGSLPTCGAFAQLVDQTATFAYTVYDCANDGVYGGRVSAMGTAFCPGGSTGGYCRINGGAIAPTFAPAHGLDSTKEYWLIWINVTSIGEGTGGVCGTPHLSALPSPPQKVPVPACPVVSPIIFDTRDEGFHLTDLAHGTVLAGVQMSWTDPRYGNGWLVRPNSDGTWTDMSLRDNFFGNLSPQPASAHPNGYLALKYFASQKGCGVVDLDDHLDAANCPALWTTVRVWIDNGDGIVQPDEIHTLDSLGYTSISLKYHQTGYVDQYGNRFRYSALVQDDQGKKRERSFDVFLVTK